MQLAISSLQVLFIFISPIFFFYWGKLVVQFLDFLNIKINLSKAVQSTVGIIVALYLILFLKCFGIGWSFVSIILAIPAIYYLRKEPIDFNTKLVPDWNLLLWISVHLIIGSSLLYTSEGLITAWMNNFGDGSFHLGQISSFALGDNFPPQYNIYPGERLSYPFLINLWSALYWWINPSSLAISKIFFFQWVYIWFLIYFLLEGRKNHLLPWVILFAGASFFTISISDYKFSWTLIEKGFPWASLLPTVWVPQRNAMLGALIVFTVLNLIKNRSYENYIFSGFLISLGLLANSHFMLAVCSFIIVLTICLAAYELDLDELKYLLYLFVGLIPAVFIFLWISNKAGVVTFFPGWIFDSYDQIRNLSGIDKFLQIIIFWLKTAGPWICLILVLTLIKSTQLVAISLAVLFIFFNFIKLSYWQFDQVKVFIGIYLILIASLANHNLYSRWWIKIICLVLITPALFETWKIVETRPHHQMFSKLDFDMAKDLRFQTAKDAIIICDHTNFNPVTLSGRYSYVGYLGNLWSHGIQKYQRRVSMIEKPENLLSCNRDHEICPDYLLWTEKEKKKWKMDLPPKEFKKTKMPFLYQVP